MPSINLLFMASVATAAATVATAAVCPSYIPSFEGPLTVVNSDNNVTEQSWWFISPTYPITAPACNTSGYVSQYAAYDCLGVYPYFSELVTNDDDSCSYGFTGENESLIMVTVYCDPSIEWLDVMEEVTVSPAENGYSTYYIKAYYAGMCSPAPTSGTSSTTTSDSTTTTSDASDTSADNIPTVQPPTDPTDAPYPTIAPYTPDMFPIWILIYVAIGLLVGSVLVFLVILSFIAIRKRRNGYECIDEDFKKAAPLPVDACSLNAEGESLNA